MSRESKDRLALRMQPETKQEVTAKDAVEVETEDE